MAQFECEVCGQGFEQKSRYEAHMATSHPEQALSAADIEKSLQGIDFPKSKDELMTYVKEKSNERLVSLVERLPGKEFRDAAEVARSFGELRSHEEKPSHQPSEKGGQEAIKSVSAAKIASLFSGIEFPASNKELRQYAEDKASKEELAVIKKFPNRTYKDMSDVAKAFGAVS